jgi:hypothetical protein
MSPKTEERVWYARMVGWSALGSGLALEFLVLPFSGGTRGFAVILWASMACCIISAVAIVISERLKRI